MTTRTRFARRLASTLTLAWVALSLAGAEARPVHLWTLDELAQKADVLAVGEVLEATTAGKIPKDKNYLRLPLLRKRAKIRILRFNTGSADIRFTKNHLIYVETFAYDWKAIRGPLFNAPMFAGLPTNTTWVLPLRRVTVSKAPQWKLIDDEAHGLLVPATRQAPDANAVGSGPDFLRAELSNTFAVGDYPDIFRAATFLQDSYYSNRDAGALDTLYSDVVGKVGDNEARWLQIAAATYCSIPYMPRPRIAELLTGQPKAKPVELMPQTVFAARALAHVSRQNLDERLIAEAVRHIDRHSYQTARMLADNYPRHPVTIRLMKEALATSKPEVLVVASELIKEQKHPLTSAAVAASVRFVKRSEVKGYLLQITARMISLYSTRRDFALLASELKKTQHTNRERFRNLWAGSVSYNWINKNKQRVIWVCRLAIRDKSPTETGVRLCDEAASALQFVTKANFGMAQGPYMLSQAKRDRAVQKARAWLQRHPSSWSVTT